MFNETIVVTITDFSGTTTPDKNGLMPVMLQCIAGTMPNRNVLSGTVAERTGFEVGKTYLANVREAGYDDDFGDDYTFIKVAEITSALDIVRATKELGAPRIQFIDKPEGFELNYIRKGDAVEGARAARIRSGRYHPLQENGNRNHFTAEEITTGTSVNSGGVLISNLPDGEKKQSLIEKIRARQKTGKQFPEVAE